MSTLEQDEALQHDALTRAGCQRIFTDKASGNLEQSPALDAMRAQLRTGDTLVVWRLDRLGRSLRHLIDTIQDLETPGVAFLRLTESIDTSTPGGKLVFHVFRGSGGVRARPDPRAHHGRAAGRTSPWPHRWQAHGLDHREAHGGPGHVLQW